MPKAQILELGHLSFVERAENVVLLGPSGVGKTHIAGGAGLSRRHGGPQGALHHGGGPDAATGCGAHSGSAEGVLQPRGGRPRLIVIDEIGYLPFGREEANLFFNVVAKRYERGSIVLTSNLPFTQLKPRPSPGTRR